MPPKANPELSNTCNYCILKIKLSLRVTLTHFHIKTFTSKSENSFSIQTEKTLHTALL